MNDKNCKLAVRRESCIGYLEAIPKCNICTLNCTLEEIAMLNSYENKATQKENEMNFGIYSCL